MKMKDKKLYIGSLATFLDSQNKIMSGEELAEHLNRNKIFTSYGAKYRGGRGTYSLIRAAWKELHAKGLHTEAKSIAKVFVKPNGNYAYK